MKTKHFFTLLGILICCEIYSQNNSLSTPYVTADVILSITESPDPGNIRKEIIELRASREMVFYKDDIIYPKVHLENKSSLKKNRYFRLGMKVDDNIGVTDPVIIPPIGKGEEGEETSNNLEIDTEIGDKKYPHIIKKPLWFMAKKQELIFYLLEYEDKKTYLEDENGDDGEKVAIVTITVYILDAVRSKLEDSSGSFITYPNPFSDSITITIGKSDIISGVTLFNHIGKQAFAKKSTQLQKLKINNSYTLNTSELEKGIYYCQIKSKSKTYFKTVIKH
ncbi:T9SS type A sorting domain-containing protein [Aquimarina sp. 2201CG5-10]|uniref:T9SS type A sorting domain-containing protein n=1 Tax=Aquimarina callyspongiae TaxID=3098150 RepID=UPI002AB41EA2|nr:T9SS type A sorting domain-containing protein [Aquimarina sp. 2201CG5-10]MDY8138125.1 T9SS type A sorting domain-containing protein [Aquimarina sp. 2201CG5-10]